MSSPKATWEDRRGLFQKGKEMHNPSNPTGRKFSETGVTDVVRRTSTSSNAGDEKPAAGTFPVAAGGRRRSSASSGGLFNNLNNMKRGSQDYGDRRASHQEMSGGGTGILSGWFNQTFKGALKPSSEREQK